MMQAMYGVLAAGVLLAGCAAMHESADFDRHTMSNIWRSHADDTRLIFDADLNDKYPDDEAGEAARRQWLTAWMEARGYCPQGFEILERRRYRPGEFNRYNRDLRYELRCTVAAPVAAGAD